MTASIAAGCGGAMQWTTESPASMGSPIAPEIPRAPGNGERNRDKQNKTHLKEDGQAHDQRRAHHCPGNVLSRQKDE